MPPFLRILIGPTASGKGRIALAAARASGAAILSVDSMKIYRRLDIGTAKPREADRAAVRHYGIDLAAPTEEYTVARYVEYADSVIDKPSASGKAPILSGGTALYYKTLLEGLFQGPGEDASLREKLKTYAQEHGSAALHARLREQDPQAAAKIHPNDMRRIVRALEVIELTGNPLSVQQREWAGFHASNEAPAYRHPFAMVALDWPREVLYKRIDARVERMIENGLLDEARMVYDNRGTFSRVPLQAVGYKEFFGYFDGNAHLEDAVDVLKKNTRHLAKSQLTWLRKFPCTWLPMTENESPQETAARATGLWDGMEAQAQ